MTPASTRQAVYKKAAKLGFGAVPWTEAVTAGAGRGRPPMEESRLRRRLDALLVNNSRGAFDVAAQVAHDERLACFVDGGVQGRRRVQRPPTGLDDDVAAGQSGRCRWRSRIDCADQEARSGGETDGLAHRHRDVRGFEQDSERRHGTAGAVGSLELDQELAQKVGEEVALVVRQRSEKSCLVGKMSGHDLLEPCPALRGEREQDIASRLRIGIAINQALVGESVDPHADRSRREPDPRPGRAATPWRLGARAGQG